MFSAYAYEKKNKKKNHGDGATDTGSTVAERSLLSSLLCT